MLCGKKKLEKYDINRSKKIPYSPTYPIFMLKLDLTRIYFEKNKPYPRTMYVFSPKHIIESFVHKTLVRIERSKIGRFVFTKIRKKFN